MTSGRLSRWHFGVVARNSLLSMAGLVVLGGTRVVYGSMVSRMTDRETYGIVGALTAVTIIASFILPGGLASAITRFVPFSRGQGDQAAALALYRVLSVAAVSAGLLLSLAGAAFAVAVLHRPISQGVEVGLLTFAYSLYTTGKAALYAFGRVGRYLVLEIIGSGVTLAATVAVLVAGWTWYLLPFVIGYGVFIVAANQALRADLGGARPRELSRDERREIVAYTALACAGTLASAGFLQATQLLAARFAGAAELGYFAAAVTLVTPMYFLPRALALALFPFMSEAHGAGNLDLVRSHADVLTRALLALLAPVFVAAMLLSVELLVIFGGPAYAEGATVLQLLLAAAFLGVIQVPSVNALSSGSGLQLRTPVGWAVGGCLVGLAIVSIIGGPLGAPGVGAAYLIGTAITASGPIVVIWRRHRMPWAGPVLRSVAVVLIALVTVSVLASADLGLERWLRDLAVTAIGLVIALVVLGGDIGHVLQPVRRRSAPQPEPSSVIERG